MGEADENRVAVKGHEAEKNLGRIELRETGRGGTGCFTMVVR